MAGWAHLPVRAVRETVLFETWEEALLLWRLLTKNVQVVALVLMPDHIHVLCREEDLPAIRCALAAYARARNARRGKSQQVWRHREAWTEVKSAKQLNRVVAYVHRNPVVDGLVDDPLAWPFSTHRDALGLAIPAVRRLTMDPRRLHEQVSLIPGRENRGFRPLPELVRAQDEQGVIVTGPWEAALGQIQAAVSSLTRTPGAMLGQRCAARALLLRSARCLTRAPVRQIADFAGVGRTTVAHVPRKKTPEVLTVARVLADDRFRLLEDANLSTLRGWPRCRTRA